MSFKIYSRSAPSMPSGYSRLVITRRRGDSLLFTAANGETADVFIVWIQNPHVRYRIDMATAKWSVTAGLDEEVTFNLADGRPINLKMVMVVGGNKMRVAIECPRDVNIRRGELEDRNGMA